MKSERLFSELFTPPNARRQIDAQKEDSDDSMQQPIAAPRRLQTDRPEITDKITVSLSYYHPNDKNAEKQKTYI